jgi:hypothetical protein
MDFPSSDFLSSIRRDAHTDGNHLSSIPGMFEEGTPRAVFENRTEREAVFPDRLAKAKKRRGYDGEVEKKEACPWSREAISRGKTIRRSIDRVSVGSTSEGRSGRTAFEGSNNCPRRGRRGRYRSVPVR